MALHGSGLHLVASVSCLINISLYFSLQQSELDDLERSEKVGGAQHHKRQVASLSKQIERAKQQISEVRG